MSMQRNEAQNTDRRAHRSTKPKRRSAGSEEVLELAADYLRMATSGARPQDESLLEEVRGLEIGLH